MVWFFWNLERVTEFPSGGSRSAATVAEIFPRGAGAGQRMEGKRDWAVVLQDHPSQG